MPVMAQKLASDNKNLFGVWYMEWFQFDKESEKIHIKNSMYTHVKVYRPDGEYACLLMSVKKDGGINILPHEHGTYSYKKRRVHRDGTQDGAGSERVLYGGREHQRWPLVQSHR